MDQYDKKMHMLNVFPFCQALLLHRNLYFPKGKLFTEMYLFYSRQFYQVALLRSGMEFLERRSEAAWAASAIKAG